MLSNNTEYASKQIPTLGEQCLIVLLAHITILNVAKFLKPVCDGPTNLLRKSPTDVMNDSKYLKVSIHSCFISTKESKECLFVAFIGQDEEETGKGGG